MARRGQPHIQFVPEVDRAMMISFVRADAGYPQARAEAPWVSLASMLESDLQGDDSIGSTLRTLRSARSTGSRIEITGNSHTISVDGAKATVVCDDDPSMGVSHIAVTDLIALISAWQSYRARGTPNQWPAGSSGGRDARRSPLQPPQA